MKDIIIELEAVNDKLRTLLTSKDFLKDFDNLSDEDKSRFIEAQNVCVNNSKILTNKLI